MQVGENLRKSMKLIVVILVLLFITLACAKKEDSNIKKVYTQSLEASKAIESFEVQSAVNQTVKIQELNDPLDDFSLNLNSKVNLNPHVVHQKSNFNGQQVEFYYTEQGIYMNTMDNEDWIVLPNGKANKALLDNQPSPEKLWIELEKYINQFQMEEKDGKYHLLLSTSEDSIKELIQAKFKQLGSELNQEIIAKMKVEKVTIDVLVNKETYYPESFNMQFSIAKEDQATINMTINNSFSNINKTENISVPEEIIEKTKNES
jgi:hypothetical protein